MSIRFDHAALYVNDLQRARDFFVTYLGAEANAEYHNPRTGLRTHFLTFDGGTRVEVMTRPGLDDPAKTEMRTGLIHLAFSLGSREAVDALTARLTHDGYTLLSGPRVTGDGYYESCLRIFEDNILELTE